MTVAPANGVEIGDSTVFDGTLSFANATALPRQSSTSATMYPLAVNSFNDGATVHHMYRDDFLTWLQALPLSGGTLTGSLASDGEVSATDANDVVHNLTEKANASSLAGFEIPDSAVADISQTPSASKYGTALYITDQQGRRVGYLGLVQETDDKLWTQIGVTRDVNGSPAYNSLWLGLKDDGTPAVYLGGSDSQQAWRGALGLGTIATAGSADYLKRKPSGTSELPQDTSTGSGFPIVLSDTFANNGVLSYMTTSNFRTLIGVSAKPTQLYNSTSGSSGTITLSQTAANFNHLRIFYRHNGDNTYFSVDVYSPNSKLVLLPIVEATSSAAWIVGRLVQISGTSVSTYNNWYGEQNTTTGASYNHTNYVNIVRVEGWND